jgi:hypothetical protein
LLARLQITKTDLLFGDTVDSVTVESEVTVDRVGSYEESVEEPESHKSFLCLNIEKKSAEVRLRCTSWFRRMLRASSTERSLQELWSYDDCRQSCRVRWVKR